MHPFRTILACAALLASGCTATIVEPRLSPKLASPTPAATPTARGTASAAPSPVASAAVAKLQRPAGAVSVLSGSIRIDASYAVLRGSNLVSNNGSQILAAGGGSLVAGSGGTLISDKGAGVVASGDGNVIAGDGLISDKGAGVISEHGAGLISEHGAGYALLADQVPTGTVLPAAGMRLRVQNLLDGSAVPLGASPDGKPVYAIYSNAAGRYEVYVPKALERNVLVVAEVPASQDARLAYNLLVSPQGQAAASIDEDSSLTARFVRDSFRGKVQEVLAAPNFDDPAFLLATFPTIAKFPAYGELIKTAAAPCAQKISQAQLPAAKLPAVASAAADAMLAFVDVTNVKVLNDGTKWTGSQDEPALPAMAAVLKQVREGVIAKGLPYVQGQAYLKDASSPVEIQKPTDLAEFTVRTYLSSTNPAVFEKTRAVFASLGVPDAEVDHLFAADNGLVIQLGIAFAADENARAAVDAAIDKVAKEP